MKEAKRGRSKSVLKRKKDADAGDDASPAKKKKKTGSPKADPLKKRKRRGDDEEDDAEDETASDERELFESKPRGARLEEGSDRGPFGGGPAVRFSEKDASDSEEELFQEGPTATAKSSQLRLLRYTQRFPGRLASRMLLKMEKATARGLVGPESGSKPRTPVVAMNHLLTVLIPGLGQKGGVRSTRELKTLGTILDHLAAGQPSMAADVVTQRVKALERATLEGHWGASWNSSRQKGRPSWSATRRCT